jgi:hypothetical protein
VVLTGFTGGICILAQSAGARCNPQAKKSFGHENSSLYRKKKFLFKLVFLSKS